MLILAQRVFQQKRNAALHVRGRQRVPFRLQRVRVAGEGVQHATTRVRRGFLLGGQSLLLLVHKRRDAGFVVLVVLVVVSVSRLVVFLLVRKAF